VVGLAAMVLAVLATAGAGASIGATASPGPFEGESPAIQGHCASGHSRFILGDEALVNQGTRRATISSISIIGAKNLQLVRSFVTKVSSRGPVTLMGVVNGSPPEFYAKGQAHLWRTRVSAAGAHVGPTRAGSDKNMLIVVKSVNPKKQSSLNHLRVQYRLRAHPYEWNGKLSYRIMPGKRC
jgi:hypothetical protein